MPAVVDPVALSRALLPEERERLRALEERREEIRRYEWPRHARENQLPPVSDWRTWLLLAGRGFGKTRTGAEWVRAQVEQGCCRRLALVAPTAADVRDVMVEGESGILAVSPPWFRPRYEPSKRRLTWPNGAIATTYSADEPERLRGPQHDGAYCDEIAAWRYPAAWDMLMFGLRLGVTPRAVATTTPKPMELLRTLLKDPNTVVTRGSTYDNRANLAPAFFEGIIARYEGTRLGRQELSAELLEDVPGALWQRAWIEGGRAGALPEAAKPLVRVVVGVDPQAGDGEQAAETGIVVAGKGKDGRGYVLADCTLRGSPNEWARAANTAYDAHSADQVVAEANQGGEMVRSTLRTANALLPVKLVHASRAKQARAEPISALYEQGRISHVGAFPLLEDQLCSWVPGEGESPDRLDALVWAFTELGIVPRRSISVL